MFFLMLIFNILLFVVVVYFFHYFWKKEKGFKKSIAKTESDIKTLYLNQKMLNSLIKDLNRRLLRYEIAQKDKKTSTIHPNRR